MATWHDLVVPEAFDNDILPFWEGLKQHEFRLHTCGRCGRVYWPMTLCPQHDDMRFDEMRWQPARGCGRIFSWVIAHRVNNPIYAADGPFALILVELDEGPIFPTRLSGRPDGLRVEDAVVIDYVDVESTGLTLPLFRRRDEH